MPALHTIEVGVYTCKVKPLSPHHDVEQHGQCYTLTWMQKLHYSATCRYMHETVQVHQSHQRGVMAATAQPPFHSPYAHSTTRECIASVMQLVQC